MNNIKIIGLGALNIDNIYRVQYTFKNGEAVIEEAKTFPGGSAANTIYGLSKLGIGTGFIGAIGNDAEGESIMQNFHKTGVDTKYIQKVDGVKTGSTLCFSDKIGNRSIYVIPGANNLLSYNDIYLSYINKANILHISSFADVEQFQQLLYLINKIAPVVKASFSPGELYSAKGLKTLSPILQRVYILFINQNELRVLTGKDPMEGAEICLKYGCRIVVVTLGKGKRFVGSKIDSAICYIRDENREYLINPVRCTENPFDTTGAGDAFASGFLYGLLQGKELEECGYLGNIVAQYCITKLGARQGLPTLNQLAQCYFELRNRQL